MKINYLLGILLWITQLSFGQNLPKLVEETEFSIGKTLQIKSEILNEDRVLNIYLPSSYTEDKAKTYPVIYLLDGSKTEDFIHISGIVQFASFSWINILPESIVVGIANVDRKRDFTYPSQNKLDQKEFPTSGKSEQFITFIQQELQPFIEKKYRTTTVKTLIGQSLGGLLATEILFKSPELFDLYIIVSPSLWWDDQNLLSEIPTSYNDEKSIYIAGGKEGEIMEKTTKALYQKLAENKGAQTQLYYEFLEDKTHGDALHIAVYNAFEKFFNTDKE
ncbi:alpha/beta hydrolase [Winogradskyella arenosi]|uniref:Alpha/beta superfamily hydrolase n=1 Tax=Winogradskyella arenosi TaxID=533325 RepID=A0A368ZJL5_9FLAO|nr:alpha/beta hydrolase-fold protein [Winogradskyella arenosi]RCW92827.1 hypothetical protein DFQ08_102863 [Winogradskyella arenosi]